MNQLIIHLSNHQLDQLNEVCKKMELTPEQVIKNGIVLMYITNVMAKEENEDNQ